MKQELIEWLKAIIFAVIFVGLINIFVTNTLIYSISMNPTLVEGDMVVLRRTKDVERLDIVSFNSSLKLTASDVSKLNFIQKIYVKEGDDKKLIKRVIGLPGDKIDILSGKVYVNDEELIEPYLGSEKDEEIHAIVPDGEFFMMGDNRNRSTDSRSSMVGTVKKEDIIGKAMFRVFPLTKIGFLD
ncbi:MAG: signal peptidase I [Acidaminobacteraceae bacterium]